MIMLVELLISASLSGSERFAGKKVRHIGLELLAAGGVVLPRHDDLIAGER